MRIKSGTYIKILCTILISFFLVPRALCEQSDYLFYKLTNSEGLSHNTVHDIVQDSCGLIWISTKEGLNKYDSYTFKKYFSHDYTDLSSDHISKLAVTEDNTLFVGTTSGMAKYNRMKDTFRQLLWEGKRLPGILSLYEASDSTLIIGTVRGLFRYYLKKDIIIKHISLQNEPITAISQLDNGTILVANNSGFYELNNDGIILKHLNSGNTSSLTTNMISQLYKDKKGNIWIGTVDKGLFLYDKETFTFYSIVLSDKAYAGSEFIRVIKEDQLGKLWIGTEAGLFIYDKEKNSSVHVVHSLEGSVYNLNDNAIYALYLSRENIMWIGTYFGGINYTELENKSFFHHIYPGNDQNDLKGKAVSQIIKDSQGIIWIATEDGGVCTFDPETKRILEYFEYKTSKGLSSNNIHSLLEDREGKIWFGHYLTGIDIYNPSDHTFRNVYPSPMHKDNMFYNSIFSLYEDSKENIWVGTRSNVKIYDHKQGKFLFFKPEKISNTFIYNIEEDREGKIWFSTRWRGIISYDPGKDSLRFYRMGTVNARGLSSRQVVASKVDSKGRIWFGTVGGGVNLYIPEKDSFEIISTAEGLANNTVYGILEDDDHNLWFSTNAGLTKYNPENAELINYTDKDGLAQKQFNFGSYFKDNKTGLLYFGSIDGLTYFDPENISGNSIPVDVFLTDFKIFNNSVKIGEKSILKQHINYTQQIELKYSQKVFTIDFVAVNYKSLGNNHFYYYLDGFDKDWIDARNRTSVSYTNILPGNYTLYIKAENGKSDVNISVKKLNIKVLRPWWFSNIALLIYVLTIIYVLLLIRRIIWKREKERSALKIEKLEKENIKQLSEQRINFFTYISHEFKTPLSIIIASVDELMEQSVQYNKLSLQFDRIRRSSKRLSFLIGQLLDFRVIESKHAKMYLQKGDVVGFIRDTCMAFSPIFSQKAIRFEFLTKRESYICLFDPDKIEKIITNLISNAIKHNSADGEIEIKCDVSIKENDIQDSGNDILQVKISNTGKVLSKEELESAFYLFHKKDSGYRNFSTGIGLTLVKSLVDYLGGSMEAQSNAEEGTQFNIEIPLNLTKASNVKLEDKMVDENRNIDLDHICYISDSEVSLDNEEPDSGLFHILIVEDNSDLAELLIGHFSSRYHVSYAQNGKVALEMVHQEEPDLIISDIMMPEMNGLDFCRSIKSNESTCHIAIILLSAKVSHEDKLEGLKAGAEAYVSKPFDFKELDLHVTHFIDRRKKIFKALYVENTLDIKNIKIHDSDKKFLESVTKIINDNIANMSFSVEEMASKMNISKSLMYLKIKKLLSISPKEYLQLLRFRKAIEFMLTTDHNISEIAYDVGFTDPNYFSRAFKKVYKITPSAYKEKIEKERMKALNQQDQVQN